MRVCSVYRIYVHVVCTVISSAMLSSAMLTPCYNAACVESTLHCAGVADHRCQRLCVYMSREAHSSSKIGLGYVVRGT